MTGRRFWARDVSCQEWVELVTAYLDGSLPPRLRRVIDRHLAGCDPCDEYVAQMRRTIELVGSAHAADAPPAELVDRLAHVYHRHTHT